MDPVEEIKARINIVDLVSRYAPLRKMGAVYKCNCPFHAERTPSFVVYPNEGRWHCFGACGTGGDIFNFVMKKENKDFREALEMLAREAGVSLEDRNDGEHAKRATIYEINDAAATYYQEILRSSPAAQGARDYIARRKLDAETLDAFRIGYAPDQWNALRDYLLSKGYTLDLLVQAGLVKRNEEKGSNYDAFRGRVMIPIRERTGRIIGFGGRVLDDSQPKYLNTSETPVFHKSHVVYGIDRANAAIRDEDRVVIVEGYMDVIAAHQHGFRNVVACMGTALTPDQLKQVQRYTSNFVLALDADVAGEAATIRGLNQARQALSRVAKPAILPGGGMGMASRLDASISILNMPQGMDPDDVVRSDPALWRRLVEGAQPLVDYFFTVVSRRYDLGSPQGKAQSVAELTPLIAELDEEIERQHYIHQLSRMVQVEEQIIDGRVRAVARTLRADRRNALHERAGAADLAAFDDTARPKDEPAAAPAATRATARKPARKMVDPEDHLLAMLMRAPDMLFWLTECTAELGIVELSVDYWTRSDNQEIFRSLKEYLMGDEMWEQDLFLERVSPPLHGKVDILLKYAAMQTARTDSELREGMIKDIVRLRADRLKNDSRDVKFLVDEAQQNGELDAARALGSQLDRINRELDHLQPLRHRDILQKSGSRRFSTLNFTRSH